MNSINILSTRVIGATPPLTPRGQSYADLSKANSNSKSNSRSQSRKASQEDLPELLSSDDEKKENLNGAIALAEDRNTEVDDDTATVTSLSDFADEKTALLEGGQDLGSDGRSVNYGKDRSGFVAAILATLRWIASTIATPGVLLIELLSDEQGKFSPTTAVRRLLRISNRRRTLDPLTQESSSDGEDASIFDSRPSTPRRRRNGPGTGPSLRAMRSDLGSEFRLEDDDEDVFLDKDGHDQDDAKVLDDESSPFPRSIRIKLYNEEALKSKKKKKAVAGSSVEDPNAPADLLKSPTSPASSLRLTRYPRSLQPPRPLIPPRQPSYTQPTKGLGQKTLILDLDETLIHSMAKGGRLSSGHMVEVKLSTVAPAGGYAAGGYGGFSGPLHPILYYVHKRPYCDEFLRKVCQDSWIQIEMRSSY
jgi:CTD nuclear envelope phosphatase 1